MIEHYPHYQHQIQQGVASLAPAEIKVEGGVDEDMRMVGEIEKGLGMGMRVGVGGNGGLGGFRGFGVGKDGGMEKRRVVLARGILTGKFPFFFCERELGVVTGQGVEGNGLEGGGNKANYDGTGGCSVM